MAISVKQILKAIDCKCLDLYKNAGDGYWIFQYDDVENDIFATRSIMTTYLKGTSKEEWIREGKDFVEAVIEVQGQPDAF